MYHCSTYKVFIYLKVFNVDKVELGFADIEIDHTLCN